MYLCTRFCELLIIKQILLWLTKFLKTALHAVLVKMNALWELFPRVIVILLTRICVRSAAHVLLLAQVALFRSNISTRCFYQRGCIRAAFFVPSRYPLAISTSFLLPSPANVVLYLPLSTPISRNRSSFLLCSIS